MSLLSGDISISLVSRNAIDRLDVTERSAWEFNSLRSRFATIDLSVDACNDIGRFLPWCDYIDVRLDNQPMMGYLYRGNTPGNHRGIVAIEGVGRMAGVNRHRHDASETFRGGALSLWFVDLLEACEQVEPLGLDVVYGDFATFGETLNVSVDEGDSMIGLHDELAGVHIVYSEHSGRLFSHPAGEVPDAPVIRPEWLTQGSDPRPAIDGDSFVNEIFVRYGPRRDQSVTWPPDGLPDPAGECRLQAQPLEYPEILTSRDAYRIAEEAHKQLSKPQIVLDDLQMDPACIDWDWLVPGRNSVSGLDGTVGEICNLDQVVVSGVGSKAFEVSARYDQVDVDSLRSKVQASA